MNDRYCSACDKKLERKSRGLKDFKKMKYCNRICFGIGNGKNMTGKRWKYTPKQCAARSALMPKGPDSPGWKGGPEASKKRARAKYFANKKPFVPKSGPEHPKWRGGFSINAAGYRVLSSGKKNSQYEHRAVMAAAIGRPLKPTEVVHHWDENKANNSLDNLCLLRSKSAHQRLHFAAEKQGVPVLALKFDQSWLLETV